VIQHTGYPWPLGECVQRCGDAAAQFVTAGLVDELIVSYAPCSLGAGARVLPVRSEWTLAKSGVNGDFVCARWTRLSR